MEYTYFTELHHEKLVYLLLTMREGGGYVAWVTHLSEIKFTVKILLETYFFC
jgi:hypothetical protein